MRLLAFLGLADLAIGVAFRTIPKEIELGKNYTVTYKPADTVRCPAMTEPLTVTEPTTGYRRTLARVSRGRRKQQSKWRRPLPFANALGSTFAELQARPTSTSELQVFSLVECGLLWWQRHVHMDDQELACQLDDELSVWIEIDMQ
jgi:hypothetical protein